MLAIAIQELLARGTTDEEIEALAALHRERAGILFTVDTLEFLAKGGRIGRARALMGNLLNVKPILTIEDGEVVPVTRVRGRQKAFEEFRRRFEEATTDGPGLGGRNRPRRGAGDGRAAAGDRAREPPPGRGQAGDEPRRGRRHACRPGHRRLLLVPELATGRTGCHTRPMSRPQPGFAAVDPPAPAGRRRAGASGPERLEAPLETLPGVGPTLKKRLAKLGLERVGDLLDHRPRRYERPAPQKRISDLFGDEEVLIEGEVRKTSLRRGRGRLQILTAQVSDGTGQISATWFNQPWLKDKLTPGTHVRLRGQQNRYGFAVKSYDLNGGSATADFAPVYPASEEVSAAKLRELVDERAPARP